MLCEGDKTLFHRRRRRGVEWAAKWIADAADEEKAKLSGGIGLLIWRRSMKTSVIAVMLLGLTTSLLANAQQPPPLQLNVPYHCANNIIVVVKHCEMKGGTEVCSL